MFILQSSINKRVLLTMGQGQARLEVNGETHHLGVPYLQVEYMPPGSSQDRVFAGYRIEGCIFAWNDQEITTPKLIAMLNFLGFQFTSESFRKKITDPTQTMVHLKKRLSLYSFEDVPFTIPLAKETNSKKRSPSKKRAS